jgi:hypothetical protein
VRKESVMIIRLSSSITRLVVIAFVKISNMIDIQRNVPLYFVIFPSG